MVPELPSAASAASVSAPVSIQIVASGVTDGLRRVSLRTIAVTRRSFGITTRESLPVRSAV